MTQSAKILKEKFSQRAGLPFADVLSEATIEQVLEAHEVKYRNRLYTPMVVIWSMLSQVLDEDKSLSNAVNRSRTWLAAEGVEELPSLNTGGYAQARNRLPEPVLRELCDDTAQTLEAQSLDPSVSWGRNVKITDGSTLLMSDTPANQKSYPQHANQASGCGFPIMRVVVSFCLFSGAVVCALMSNLHTAEITLARAMYYLLEPGDIALGDCAYGAYTDIGLIWSQGADVIFGQNTQRDLKAHRVQRLGPKDYRVRWKKPQKCPKNMNRELFDSLPEVLELRQIEVVLGCQGFRDKSVVIVTSLLDPKVYRKAQIAELYRLRWEAELDLRHLKTTLNMEMISAKTPAMVRKEVYTYLLGYNLLRGMMGQAAKLHGVWAIDLSLQGARQSYNQTMPLLSVAGRVRAKRLMQNLLESCAASRRLRRKRHSEPRVLKQRPKPFKRMDKPRSVLRKQLPQRLSA